MKITHLLLASLAITGSLYAAPVIDINFSEGTTGATPPVTASPIAGAVITRATSTYVNNGGSLLLADDYTAGTATLSGRSVVMSVASVSGTVQNAQINIRANGADFSANQDYRLTFDLLVNGSVGNLAKNSLRVNFYNETFAAGGYQASMVLYNNHTQLISGGTNTVFNNTWTADTVLSWEINVLYSTSTLEVKVNGAAVGSIALTPAALAGIGGVQFQNGASDSSFQLALANIEAQSIPEPAAVASLGAGAMLLALLNRKRRRA